MALLGGRFQGKDLCTSVNFQGVTLLDEGRATYNGAPRRDIDMRPVLAVVPLQWSSACPLLATAYQRWILTAIVDLQESGVGVDRVEPTHVLVVCVQDDLVGPFNVDPNAVVGVAVRRVEVEHKDQTGTFKHNYLVPVVL